MKSVLELITALRRGELAKEDYLRELDTLQEICRQRQQRLPRIEVSPEDQTAWESLIRPGLTSAYRCVYSAADEAKVYAQKRDAKMLPGIQNLLDSAERINRVLENSLPMLSGWSQDQIAQELSDRIQVYHREGVATSELNFIEFPVVEFPDLEPQSKPPPPSDEGSDTAQSD